MARRITILQGHPDPRGGHFGNALADAYAAGAREAGHEVKLIEVTRLDVPLLRSADDFYSGAAPDSVLAAQEAIRWCEHLLIVYPLWQGHFPAVLHAFLEQAFRPGFAVETRGGGLPKQLMKGKSARIVVTMGMPAPFYRWFYRAHSVKSLERNLLRFSGFGPVSTSLIGAVGAGATGGSFERDFPALAGAAARGRWLDRMRALGRQAR